MTANWHRHYVESMTDAIVLVDTQKSIHQWTPQAAEMFGWSADEVVGENIADLLTPPMDDQLSDDHRYFSSLGETVPTEQKSLTTCHRDQHLLNVMLTTTTLKVGEKRFLAYTFRRGSDGEPNNRAGSATIGEELSNAELLLDIEQEKPTKNPSKLEVVTNECILQILKKIKWSMGHCLLVESSGRRLVSTGVWVGDDDQTLPKESCDFQSSGFELGQGLAGTIWENHKPVWVNGEEARNCFATYGNTAANIQSAFAIPVFVDGEIAAVLEFFDGKFVKPDRDVTKQALRGAVPFGAFLQRRRWQELKTFLAAIVESSTDAIIGKDPHGRIVSWNDGAEQVYGFTHEEAVGESIQLILPQGTSEEEQEIQDALVSGRPLSSFETIRRHKNGNLLNVSLTISPIRDELGQLIGSATIERDITGLKETIRDLYDREEKLRLLMEASGEAIYGIDLQGCCTFANHACAKVLGFESVDSIIGQSMHELIHHSRIDGSPYPIEECPISQALNPGKGVHISGELFWRQDGTSFPVDYWASPVHQGDEIVGAVIIFEDATQKIAAERTQAELAAIVESSGEAIIGKDLDGVITSWNRGAKRLYGYVKDRAIGRDYADLILGEPSHRKTNIDHIRPAGSVSSYETQRVRNDGMTIQVGITESGIFDARGQLIGIASIERDITNRKQREKELEQARKDAEIANQAKSEFIANISHELRTPMNAVLGMLRIALEEPLPAALRDYLATASDSAETLLLILDDLLDFSRMESGKFELDPEPFYLRQTVERVMRTLATRAHEKGLEFAFDIAAAVPDRLHGDSFRLSQVIMNLVGNAIKFTNTGEIFVEIASENIGENRVLIQGIVRDTGVGIEKKHLRRIFEPFTQVDSSSTRARTGSGLGLSICRELIFKMGGEIAAESEIGKGTQIRFSADFKVLQQPVVSPDTREISKRRTLIIDDSQTNREVLTKVFSEWNVECVSAPSAQRGIELMREASKHSQSFSLAIVDQKMPEKSGIDFIQEIRKEGFRLPVVLMVSASEGLSLARQTKQLGIATMLQKPVTRSDIFDAIMTVLKGSVTEIPVSNLPDTKAFRQLSLLAAEDTPANQKVISAILERRGHTVTVVDSGVKAVEEVQSQEFDAVLMDVQMPFMDGIQATRRIRELGGRYSSVPIIAMTAHARREDRNRCMKAGMTGYVSKPIHAERMIELVEALAFSNQNQTRGEIQSVDLESQNARTHKESIVDLEIALKRMGGDREILRELIQAFLEDAPGLLREFKQAIVAEDLKTAHRAIHSIKGLAANFEAQSLVELAVKLEKGIRQKQVLLSDQEIKLLATELRTVINSLQAAQSKQ